jgi:tetratricopeptide (TPR) repeat protein
VEYVHTVLQRPMHDRAWEVAVKAATSPEQALAVGLRAFEEKKWSIAVKGLEVARDRYSEDADEYSQAAFRLGQARRNLGQVDRALEAFDDAIAAGHVQARNLKGYLLMQEDRLEEAEEAFTVAIERGNRTAAFNLLEVLDKRGRLSVADDRFGKAVEKGNPAAALMLGTVKHSEGDLDEADRLYRAGEGGDRKVDAPHRKRARMLRALIAEERGRTSEATKLFQDAWDQEQ